MGGGKFIVGVVVQTCVFWGALVLTNNFGHDAGRDASLAVVNGMQILIGLLLVRGRTERLRECLLVVLCVYHTILLPASLIGPGSDGIAVAWQGGIGTVILCLNFAVYYYIGPTASAISAKGGKTGTKFSG